MAITKTIERPRTDLKVPPGILIPEIENDLTRRDFLIGGAAALLLAGCGGDGENEGTSASGETRTVRHAMGETEVPENPERVVVLDNGALGNMLALGVEPVGATVVFAGGGFPSYLEGQAQGIEVVGDVNEPNFETIALQDPDLIIGSRAEHGAIYDRLSEIAPTVFSEGFDDSWQENLMVQAKALGEVEEARRLISDYEARLEEFKRAMGDRLENTEVSIVRSKSDEVRVYLKDSFAGRVVQDAGLSRPQTQDETGFILKVSAERIPILDADAIFLAEQEPGDSLIQSFMGNPLWSRLEAVRKDRVYEVAHEVWISGLDVQAANLVLDDLFEYLVKGRS